MTASFSFWVVPRLPLSHTKPGRFQRAMDKDVPQTIVSPVGPPLSPLEALESDRQDDIVRAGRRTQIDSRAAVVFRHSGWQRPRSLVASALQRTDQCKSRTRAFADCGAQAFVLRSLDDPSQYRIAGSSCHDRFCLPCATERSCVIGGNVLELIKGKPIRFLTLTIKTTHEPLAGSLDKLYKSFQALRRRRIWRKHVTGGVAFLEVKWSPDARRWHPHLHCLVQGSYIDKSRLSRSWHEITTDSFIIDIRRPPNDAAVTRYVTKYASKPFNNTYLNRPELLDEAILALAGRKLALTFGTWRGAKLTGSSIDGCWEPVAALETILNRAARGHAQSRFILECLTNRKLDDFLPRSPPPLDLPEPKQEPLKQLTWYGTWNRDGTYVNPEPN